MFICFRCWSVGIRKICIAFRQLTIRQKTLYCFHMHRERFAFPQNYQNHAFYKCARAVAHAHSLPTIVHTCTLFSRYICFATHCYFRKNYIHFTMSFYNVIKIPQSGVKSIFQMTPQLTHSFTFFKKTKNKKDLVQISPKIIIHQTDLISNSYIFVFCRYITNFTTWIFC